MDTLPTDDARVPIHRRLAAINAKSGYDRLGIAEYEGGHWFATYALLYSRTLAASGNAAKPATKKPDGQ